MDIGIEGIQCDAEGCDYINMDIEWGSTPEEILAVNDQYLNEKCPKCGAPLLTPEDHANIKLMVLLQPEITQLEEMLKGELPEDSPLHEQVKVNVEMDGSGKMNFKL